MKNLHENENTLKNKRKLLVETLEERFKIPYWLIFFIGLSYLYFFEYLISYYFLNTPINIHLILGALGWISLWVLAIGGMVHVKNRVYTTINALRDKGYYDNNKAEDLKDLFLNLKVCNRLKHITWRIIIYAVLSIMLFVGIMTSTISYIQNPNSYVGYTIIEKGVCVYGPYMAIIHWIITVALTVLIYDIVIVVLSAGLITPSLLDSVKGNIDFYDPNRHGGMESIGGLMRPAIILYFTCLTIFSLLLGIYGNVIYYVYTIAAWFIGIVLIWHWQNITSKVIKKEKEESLRKIAKEIKKIESEEDEEPCGKPQGINSHITNTAAATLWQATGNPQVERRGDEIEKNLKILNLKHMYCIIIETKENLINWDTIFFIILPVIIQLLNLIKEFWL